MKRNKTTTLVEVTTSDSSTSLEKTALLVPSCPPTTNGDCEIIKIDYFVHVSISRPVYVFPKARGGTRAGLAQGAAPGLYPRLKEYYEIFSSSHLNRLLS